MGEGTADGKPVSLEAILEVVYIYCNGDREQVNRWLRTPLADLNQAEPLTLIKRGQTDRLVPVIQKLLGEIETR